MQKSVSKLTIFLILVVVILSGILAYGVYTGIKVKEELINLNSQINRLNEEKDVLQKKYDLMVGDVAEIYKTCMKENVCKGRYPNVSWYCNNVGDETGNPSHTCICDSSCNLVINQI